MQCRGYILLTFIALIFLCMSAIATAQTRDTLKEVRVTAKKKPIKDVKADAFAPGQQVVGFDSTTLKQYGLQNVANMLAQQASVFVKAYSFNGLATLNFRGASSAQSQVLWNGVPIQNAALGLADVSELPVLLLANINILYGGSAALWGSGNVGGALMIDNESPVFDSGLKHVSVTGGLGSFAQYALGLSAARATKKWYFSVKSLGQNALNNFPYNNENGRQQNMTNGALQDGSVMMSAAYKANDKNIISASAWWQQYDREIPPALFETYSVKRENDNSLRVQANWNHKNGDSVSWYVKSSFIRDAIQYDDASILLYSDNSSYQYFQEAGLHVNWRRLGQMLLFVPIQISWMHLPDSNSVKYQERVAIAGAYDLHAVHNRLNIAANARVEHVNSTHFLLPGADAAFLLTNWLSLRANVQRTYRVPTLNELYYYPGGNSALLPEQGWNEDAGYALNFKYKKWLVKQDASIFTRDIHDWIIWLGGAIWTPHNIAEVHSRGVETENKLEYIVNNNCTLHLNVNTGYVLATTVTSYVPNDGSVGKQIPYMPRYNGQCNIGCTYKKWYLNYNETYTGYRFTVSDESAYLLPYQTGNVQLMYSTYIKAHALQFTVQCNNIWNEQYTIVANRPMPGINWLAGCKYNIF